MAIATTPTGEIVFVDFPETTATDLPRVIAEKGVAFLDLGESVDLVPLGRRDLERLQREISEILAVVSR